MEEETALLQRREEDRTTHTETGAQQHHPKERKKAAGRNAVHTRVEEKHLHPTRGERKTQPPKKRKGKAATFQKELGVVLVLVLVVCACVYVRRLPDLIICVYMPRASSSSTRSAFESVTGQSKERTHTNHEPHLFEPEHLGASHHPWVTFDSVRRLSKCGLAWAPPWRICDINSKYSWYLYSVNHESSSDSSPSSGCCTNHV